MVMPLDLYVTPFTDPAKAPIAGEGLQRLGAQLSETALRKRQLSEQGRQFDVENARRTASDKSTAAYHEDLIDARREGSREMARQKREARAAALLQEMRKAAAQNRYDDVEAIRQQLTSLGYATEEGDTAFDPEGGMGEAPMPEAPQPAAPGAPAPKLGPKVDPKFAKALGQEMGRPEPEDPFGLGGPAIEAQDPGQSPMPWEALGMAPPKPPAKPKKGGRFTVKDPEGFTVSSMDVPMERERKRSAVEEALEPYIEDPANPEQRAAAKRASAMGQRLIDGGYSDHAAIQAAREQMNKDMQRYRAQKLPSAAPAAGTGAGGGSLGVSRQEQGRLGTAEAYTLKVVTEARQEEAVVKARQDVSAAEHLNDLLSNPDDAFANRMGMMNELHRLIGSAQTRSEIENALGGAGAIAKLEMDVGNWTDGGRMPEPIRTGFQRAALAAKRAAQKRLDDAGNKVYDFIQNNPSVLTPEEREKAGNAGRNMVSGTPTGPAPKAGGATGRARAEAWLKGQK
jgi:hypothetical protein